MANVGQEIQWQVTIRTKSMIEKQPVSRMHVAYTLRGRIVRKRVATAARKQTSPLWCAQNATMNVGCTREIDRWKLTHEDDLALVQADALLFPISTRSRPPARIVTRLHVAPVSRLWRAGRCHPVVTLHLTFLQQPDSVVVMAETISVM